jgi:hypothetical protein
MKLDHALSELEYIQARIRGAERVVCFRWATTLGVGGLAIVAAAAQSKFVTQPIENPWNYFVYWTLVAIAAVGLTGGEILYRNLFLSSTLQRRQTRQALLDFAPAVLVGGGVSLFLVAGSPTFAPLLPALWLACFSLGLFSLRSRMPSQAMWVAGFYALAAIVAVRSIESSYALSSWLMGASFGIGHFLMAGVLYFSAEDKPHDSQD